MKDISTLTREHRIECSQIAGSSTEARIHMNGKLHREGHMTELEIVGTHIRRKTNLREDNFVNQNSAG